jgi:acetyl-CoA carboxylase carboxyl transferase subunit alpha
MVVGHDTACGHDTLFKIAHNFNMVEASGHRKALRLVRLADRLRMPILTLIDTPGASVGVRSESEGQVQVMGELLDAMLGVSVPTVAFILGEGGSGGAVPLASADRLLMTDASYCSVLSPEAAALILLKDPAKAPHAAEALKLTPGDLKALGLVDRILPVGEGSDDFAVVLRNTFLACLRELDGRPDVVRRARVSVQQL